MRRRYSSQKKGFSKEPSLDSKPAFEPLTSRPFAVQAKADREERSPDLQNRENSSNSVPIFEPDGGRSLPIQPKLTIGATGDKYEQEADRVATQVVQQINSPTANQPQSVQRDAAPDEEELQRKPMLQRDTLPEEEDELQMKPEASEAIAGGDASEELESAIHAARGSGQPLAPNLQQQMGRAMAADFSGVRVHTDTQAHQLNQSIQAKAFTTGQDIFFRQGTYQPENRSGQELIAHELTHVVQQSGGQGTRVSAKRQRANIKLSLPKSGQRQPIQRLSLHNTDWSRVTRIKASSEGVGGVLFISDPKSTLVVKPDVHKDEEMIASHLHGAMSEATKKERGGKWNIARLDRRFATLNDVKAIKHQATKTNAMDDSRTQRILGSVRPDTTMIQELAKGASGYGELLQDQAKKGGHIINPEDRKVGKTSKIKEQSPLKPLTKDPSFAIALGRLAAADIFLGNFDRIMGSANLDNLLMNFSKGKINPIDNVDPASKVRFTKDQGANDITLNDWIAHPIVTMFLNGQYMDLAAEAWDPDLLTTNTHMKFIDEIVTGEKPGAMPREYNVKSGERDAVIEKLKKHLDPIMASFADGLAIGKAEILRAGPLPKNGQWSDNSADLYNERLNVL